MKVRVLSQQTNLSWHARGSVSIVVYELMTEAAASVASMVATPLVGDLSLIPGTLQTFQCCMLIYLESTDTLKFNDCF